MLRFNSFFRCYFPVACGAAYLLTVALFLWATAQFFIPGKGFSCLIRFGDRPPVRYLPELRALNYYKERDSPGYDAQYYAQIAMRPEPRDPALGEALDDRSYRLRRILFCWTAWVMAGGNSARALQLFAVENIACWVLLAALLLRWFPPTGWSNYVRWSATLFCSGLCLSVSSSLLDGPSLLLVAAGVALAEMGRPWLAAAVLGVAGLGKETNILGGAVLAWPRENTRREWMRITIRGLVVALPLLAWMACLRWWLGPGNIAGARNFDLPLVGYFKKWPEVVTQFAAGDFGMAARRSLTMLVALTTQFLFFVGRPRWRETWWHIGAAYLVLMVFLGGAVWEGYPGAAMRVLLPMTLAFNVLVPRGPRWWPVLLLGNLTVIAAPDILMVPAPAGYRLEGSTTSSMIEPWAQDVEVSFDAQWLGPEHSYFEYWRWSRGPADLIVHNPHAFNLRADVSFGLMSNDDRRVAIRAKGRILWEGEIGRALRDVTLSDMILLPGDNLVRFETDRPTVVSQNRHDPSLAFRIWKLKVDLKSVRDAPAAK